MATPPLESLATEEDNDVASASAGPSFKDTTESGKTSRPKSSAGTSIETSHSTSPKGGTGKRQQDDETLTVNDRVRILEDTAW